MTSPPPKSQPTSPLPTITRPSASSSYILKNSEYPLGGLDKEKNARNLSRKMNLVVNSLKKEVKVDQNFHSSPKLVIDREESNLQVKKLQSLRLIAQTSRQNSLDGRAYKKNTATQLSKKQMSAYEELSPEAKEQLNRLERKRVIYKSGGLSEFIDAKDSSGGGVVRERVRKSLELFKKRDLDRNSGNGRNSGGGRMRPNSRLTEAIRNSCDGTPNKPTNFPNSKLYRNDITLLSTDDYNSTQASRQSEAPKLKPLDFLQGSSKKPKNSPKQPMPVTTRARKTFKFAKTNSSLSSTEINNDVQPPRTNFDLIRKTSSQLLLEAGDKSIRASDFIMKAPVSLLRMVYSAVILTGSIAFGIGSRATKKRSGRKRKEIKRQMNIKLKVANRIMRTIKFGKKSVLHMDNCARIIQEAFRVHYRKDGGAQQNRASCIITRSIRRYTKFLVKEKWAMIIQLERAGRRNAETRSAKDKIKAEKDEFTMNKEERMKSKRAVISKQANTSPKSFGNIKWTRRDDAIFAAINLKYGFPNMDAEWIPFYNNFQKYPKKAVKAKLQFMRDVGVLGDPVLLEGISREELDELGLCVEETTPRMTKKRLNYKNGLS